MTGKKWTEIEEVGSAFGIWSFVVFCTLLGRPAARALLHVVILYYGLLRPGARKASRSWLARIHGRERVTRTMVYKHLLRFGQVTLDRLFFIRKQLESFQVTIHGEEGLLSLRSQGRGALILSAHLGSFEAMRARAGVDDMPINFIGFFRNARAINSAIRALDPESRARVIELHPGRISSLLAVRDCIERGEFVAALADRPGVGGETVEVEFLGSTATMPGGIYRLAASLQCPVYLTFGLYRAPDRYDIHCELFAERIEMPRDGRRKAMTAYAQRFADRLSHYARMAPDNWFNFYDYWVSRHEAA